jgi:dTDP-4-dehydrorhamnose 3,5-epimerase
VNEVLLFTPTRAEDDRGWFVEAYNLKRETDLGISDVFVQDNHSYSRNLGTIRGIHFQIPPMGQAKLVRCIHGSVIDYAVDLRRNSLTYGNYVCADLSAISGQQIYIPVGFGHAFVTLEDHTEISYKVSNFYSPDFDAGIRWNCPKVGIDWPIKDHRAIVSDKDRFLPLLHEFESPFEYDGRPLQLKIVD